MKKVPSALTTRKVWLPGGPKAQRFLVRFFSEPGKVRVRVGVRVRDRMRIGVRVRVRVGVRDRVRVGVRDRVMTAQPATYL